MVMKSIDEINEYIKKRKQYGLSIKEVSDTHHTFGDYVDMRNMLFIALSSSHKDISWKSKRHFDEENDPMYLGDFIAGINTSYGQITFHLKMKYWDLLDVKELEHAPKYDGYNEEEVKLRIKKLIERG